MLRINLIPYLQTQPKSFSLVLCCFLLISIGLIDYNIPTAISLSIFYLIPVGLTTWLVGELAGVALSITSAIIWYFANPMKEAAALHPLIPYWNATMRFMFYGIVNYLLSEFKYYLEREKKISRTDSITGITNSRGFFELAEAEIYRSRRYRDEFTIVYIDVDNFKQINDCWGRRKGDTVLKKIAQTMKNTIRENDRVARLGGDEFVLLLPQTSYETAREVIDTIQNTLLQTMREHEWPITFSIGAVTFEKLPHSVEETIEQADIRMTSAKMNGKNKVKHERLSE